MEGRRSWTGSKSSWGNIRTADAPRTVGIQHLFRCNGGSFDGRVLDFEDCSGCLGIQGHGQLGLCGGVVVIAHISWQFTVFSSTAQNGRNERVLFTRFRHRFGGGKCASVPIWRISIAEFQIILRIFELKFYGVHLDNQHFTWTSQKIEGVLQPTE